MAVLTNEEAVIVQAVAADTELAARARAIAEKLLRKVESIVEHGTDAAVMQLAQRVMPALLKAMNDRGNDDDLRKLWEELRAEMREYANPEVERDGEVGEDAPPPAILAETTSLTGKPAPAKIRTSNRSRAKTK